MKSIYILTIVAVVLAVVILASFAIFPAARQSFTPPPKMGTLAGKMTIGPICPVERIGQPCNPTPEIYTAHAVYIYRNDHRTVIDTLFPDADGQFNTMLPVGDYWVDVTHQAVGSVTGVPAETHISAEATTTLNISINTGIR